MKDKFTVTTKTGLSFTYNERWNADAKMKELQTMAGELRVPFFVRLTKYTTDGDRLTSEVVTEWETE